MTRHPVHVCMVLLLSVLVMGCTGRQPTPTLIPTPTTIPTPTIEPGWARHAAHRFEVDVPTGWIALEPSPETIDALIRKVEPTNPRVVPSLEALKKSEALKFWALDPVSPPDFAVTFGIGHEVRLIRSLDDYLLVVRQGFQRAGRTIVTTEKFNVGGNGAVRLRYTSKAHYPNGQEFVIQQEMVIVDQGGDRFVMAMAYPPSDDVRYIKLFNAIVQTFRIVE